MAEITFYGADWCSDCRRSKSLLNTLGVEYDMKDVEQSAELEPRQKQLRVAKIFRWYFSKMANLWLNLVTLICMRP